MYNECRHIMPDGRKCQAVALKDRPYCFFHNRLHHLASGRKPAPKEPPYIPALEDRDSVQVALTHVLNALASSRIDPRRAGQILYGLQIAAHLAPLVARRPASDSVHSLTYTDEGDELAPEASYCDEDEDCEACAVRDACEYYKKHRDDDKDEDNDEDE